MYVVDARMPHSLCYHALLSVLVAVSMPPLASTYFFRSLQYSRNLSFSGCSYAFL